MQSSQHAALVEPDWVADHLTDPGVRLVRADRNVDPLESPSLPNSVVWLWDRDMQASGRHDIPDAQAMAALLSRSGIAGDTLIVLYGGANNWYAAYAFWLLRLYGHQNVRMMAGGVGRWGGNQPPATTDVFTVKETRYVAQEPDWSHRAFRADVESALGNEDTVLVDVRSPAEFKGEVYAPNTPPRFGERAGHIPGARHVFCNGAVNEDGTFKRTADLRKLFEEQGVTSEKEVIPYCTLGARSAQTWFVLAELLGYPRVKLYDGSWGEWGNLIGVPIEA